MPSRIERRVVSPYVVMLYNIPTTRDADRRIVCRYSNQDLSAVVAHYVGSLKNTIKVVYKRRGAELRHDAAFAYAVFTEYSEARDVSLMFQSDHRGYTDYLEYLRSRRGEDVIYGWLASGGEICELIRMGMKHLARPQIRTLGEIEQEKLRELEQLDIEYAKEKAEIAKLDEQLDRDQAALTAVIAELVNEEQRKQEMMAAMASERAEILEEIDMTLMVYREQLERAQTELREKQIVEKQFKAQSVQSSRLIRRVDELRAQCARVAMQKEDYERRNRIGTFNYTQALKAAKRAQEKTGEYRRLTKEVREKTRELRETVKIRRVVDLATEEGFAVSTTECTHCSCLFTPVMTLEEQRAKGISDAAFAAMNKEESTDSRCWRNVVYPCRHARVCGGCLQQWKESLTEGKVFACDFCRVEIESFEPARLS